MRLWDLFKSWFKKKPVAPEVVPEPVVAPREAPEPAPEAPEPEVAREPVFCSRCSFLGMISAAEGGGWLCKAAEIEYRDDWFEPVPFTPLPQEKNAGNDCPDYKRKKA